MNAQALPLEGRRILLVEDNFGIARSLSLLFKRYGAQIAGPAGTLEDALAIIAHGVNLDGAVLDINIRDEPVYPVADALHQHGVPMVFVTGYDEAFVSPHYADIPCMLKPWNAERLVQVLAKGIQARMPPVASRRL